VKGSIQFDTQINRENLPKIGKLDPHESRFEILNDNPKISSKYRTNTIVELNKTSPRKPIFTGKCENPMQYNPNINFIRERISKNIMRFSKQSKRVNLFGRTSSYSNQTASPEKITDFYDKINKPKCILQFDKTPTDIQYFPRYLQVFFFFKANSLK